MKIIVSVLVPVLLLSGFQASADESGAVTGSNAGKFEKSALIQSDNAETGTAVDTVDARSGKANKKNVRLENTRETSENIQIADRDARFLNSDYIGIGSEMCTFNRASYTYSCR